MGGTHGHISHHLSVKEWVLYHTTVILTLKDKQEECGQTGQHSKMPIQKNFMYYIKYILKREYKGRDIVR